MRFHPTGAPGIQTCLPRLYPHPTLFTASPCPCLSCFQKDIRPYTGARAPGGGGAITADARSDWSQPVFFLLFQELATLNMWYLFPHSPSPVSTPLQVGAAIPQTSRLTLQGHPPRSPRSSLRHDFPFLVLPDPGQGSFLAGSPPRPSIPYSVHHHFLAVQSLLRRLIFSSKLQTVHH